MSETRLDCITDTGMGNDGPVRYVILQENVFLYVSDLMLAMRKSSSWNSIFKRSHVTRRYVPIEYGDINVQFANCNIIRFDLALKDLRDRWEENARYLVRALEKWRNEGDTPPEVKDLNDKAAFVDAMCKQFIFGAPIDKFVRMLVGFNEPTTASGITARSDEILSQMQADGLLDRDHMPTPEASGSGLFYEFEKIERHAPGRVSSERHAKVPSCYWFEFFKRYAMGGDKVPEGTTRRSITVE